ncbi:hypothetical protein IAD21_03444 [Abditibacteriota bacterium]|nr:hypothetical protein IAD21_03444 [Abditibacteriota bacterium]
MKTSVLLSLVLAVGILAPVQAKPIPKKPTAPAKVKDAMPAEVRALLPTGATSLYFGKLPMGAGGKPLLVHLWAAGRKSYEGAPHQFEPSPFCVDIFQQHGTGPNSIWSRICSTVYLGEDGPRDSADVTVRWLHPKTKQHPVLIIVSPSYIATRYTVITYPMDVESVVDATSYIQEFLQGGIGGGKTVYDFGVDARGTMTVLEKSWYQDGPVSTTVLVWNGRQYVANSSSQK